MKRYFLPAVLASLFIAGSAFAATGPFVEANLGYSGTGTANISDLSGDYQQKNKNHFGWNVNAGMMFMGLGVEAGYTRYADIAYNHGNESAPANLYGTHLALRSVSNLGPIFILGKIGYGQLNRGGFSLGEATFRSHQSSGLFWGFGLGLKIMPPMTVQAEYQQTQGNNNLPTANMMSLGIGYTL